jgi:hypothetical protein
MRKNEAQFGWARLYCIFCKVLYEKVHVFH